MTKIKTCDNRKTNQTFGDIPVGAMFTEPELEEIFIKIPMVELKDFSTFANEIPQDALFNAISLSGDLCTFSDEEEIDSIEEILVTMK